METKTVRIWIFIIVAFFTAIMISIVNELTEYGLDWYTPILIGIGLGLFAVLTSRD